MCVCDVYLVVVPEPFSVSQSWGGGVTGNLQIKQAHDLCKPGSLVFIIMMHAVRFCDICWLSSKCHLPACSRCLYHLLNRDRHTKED